MSNKHQNQTKTAIMIMVIISAIVLMGGNIISVNAKKLSDQQRYDSGWKDGSRDCGNSDVINSYIQSSAYLGHSDLYHQGYKAAAYNCGNGDNNNYPSSHYSSVSAPSDNQNGYSQNDNNNNRNQAQGQTNTQKVVCIIAIGTCPTTSGQSEGLSN